MKVKKEFKERQKKQRLDQLQQRYFELEMDLIALEAIGDEETSKRADITRQHMEQVKKSFAAIEAMNISN